MRLGLPWLDNREAFNHTINSLPPEDGMYEERRYRGSVDSEGLVRSEAAFRESDLLILAAGDVAKRSQGLLMEAREALESYIGRDGGFRTALEPHDPLPGAPLIARRMADSARSFGVGPMAAVAGAVAEYVGEAIEGDVIVENGGDIYARTARPITVSLHAGEGSPFTGKVKFVARPGGRAIGIATSSGTLGPSLSFGKADAVCAVCDSAVDADAAATAYCNAVRSPSDVERVIAMASAHGRVKGIVIAIGDRLGAWGEIEFAQ
jgi:ApbE superfamily uncharacterized protein (UPF0280 family)